MANTITEGEAAVAPSTTDPNLSLTFQELYYTVGRELFNLDSGMSADQLTEAKRIVNEAYLFVVQAHDWSFLTPTTTLTVAEDDTETSLPANFSGEIIGEAFFFAPGENSRSVRRRPLETIYRLRARDDASSSFPQVFALVTVAATANTGQRWQAAWYPTVDTETTLYYTYRIDAVELSGNTDIPIGGQFFGMVLRAACLMFTEQEQGETKGMFYRNFYGDGGQDLGILGRAKKSDQRRRSWNLGQMANGEGRAWMVAPDTEHGHDVVTN